MTIAGRNKILVLGICVSTLLAIGGIGCCIVLTAHNTLAAFPTPARSAVWILRQPLFAYNQYAALLGVVSFPLVALILLIYIFFLFEKTHALEISFFSLFIFALSLESLQLLFPLQKLFPLLTVFLPSTVHIIFFFRFWGCLSLLTASLFAHKAFTRETGSIIFLLSFVSFALSHTIPVNTVRTLSFFLFSQSYVYLLYSFTGIVCALAVLSFLFVGIFRGIPEYREAAFWLFALVAAHAALLYTGSWFFTAAGIIALAVGSFFFIRAVHRFYLWQ